MVERSAGEASRWSSLENHVYYVHIVALLSTFDFALVCCCRGEGSKSCKPKPRTHRNDWSCILGEFDSCYCRWPHIRYRTTNWSVGVGLFPSFILSEKFDYEVRPSLGVGTEVAYKGWAFFTNEC